MRLLAHIKLKASIEAQLIALLVCVQDLATMGRVYGDTQSRLDGKRKPSKGRDTQVRANLYPSLHSIGQDLRLRLKSQQFYIVVMSGLLQLKSVILERYSDVLADTDDS